MERLRIVAKNAGLPSAVIQAARRAAPILGLAAHLGHGAQRVATDADRYRQGALYAYVAPLITAGMGGMQAESIAIEGLRRGVAALGDLETVPLLQKSL